MRIDWGMSSVYALPWRWSTVKGPTNLGNSFRVSPVHTAYVGSVAVESITLSPMQNTFSFALLCASAYAFCFAIASAIASLTKRMTASRLYMSSLANTLCVFPCTHHSVAPEWGRWGLAQGQPG